MHRAVGGFGALNVYKRAPIPLPYDPPAGDFTMLIGDWYNATHKVCVCLVVHCWILLEWMLCLGILLNSCVYDVFVWVLLQALRQTLDAGFALKNPDALLINGVTKSTSFTGDQGIFTPFLNQCLLDPKLLSL